MTNSRRKGAEGEREAAKKIRANSGPNCHARRGQQFSGSPDSPDIADAMPGAHIECKRLKQIAAMRFMEQAVRDAGDNVPLVVMREDRGPWCLMLRLDDLMEFARAYAGTYGTPIYPKGDGDE